MYLARDATIPSYELLAFQGAVGPILHTSGGTWLDGFFVQPKLSFEIGSHMLLKQTLWSIEAAVDAGYQLRRGHFYGALLVGVGLGYGEFELGPGRHDLLKAPQKPRMARPMPLPLSLKPRRG